MGCIDREEFWSSSIEGNFIGLHLVDVDWFHGSVPGGGVAVSSGGFAKVGFETRNCGFVAELVFVSSCEVVHTSINGRLFREW